MKTAEQNQVAMATDPKRTAAVGRPFSVRGFASMLLVLCMIVMLASGIALYIAPRGRVANSISWTALSISRQQWAALHINASLLFGIAASTHIVMNGSRLVGYIKKRSKPAVNMKRELASAIAVTVVIVAGTLLELAPINFAPAFKDVARSVWEQPQVRTDVRSGPSNSRPSGQSHGVAVLGPDRPGPVR
ncbi:DUF4405 domain-containing protein [Stieleria mannarensis]|uniref:DUF4405 domain-containing protein n=1 Tax=Stieleria mannarensis TaxID=2755585 RepID=UPI00160002F9|nr:DUF4405 domain-containing protein [Rhodopirellula sp. JC639]